MAENFDDEVIHAQLQDGQRVCIRTISADDRGLMKAGIEALTPRSRYLRFFSPSAAQPEVVLDRLLDTEGDDHLAWGAIDMAMPGRPAIGAVHAIRPSPDAQYDYSIAVLDAYQGRGLGTLLTAVVLMNCRALNIGTLQAQVLLENRPAISLLRTLGAEGIQTHGAVGDYRLDVARALGRLREMENAPWLEEVRSQLAPYF